MIPAADCKHRWEETDYGRKYLNEGTVVYMCRRCCEARLVSLVKKEQTA